MNRLRSFLAVTLLVLSASRELHAQTIQTQGIVWSDRKLTWDDFQEKGSFRHDADTHWMLLLKTPDTEVTKVPDSVMVGVKALFIPILSWVNPGRPKSSYLLAHEQLHFDIVELAARQMRKEIGETRFTVKSWKKELDKIRRSAISRARKMQQKYDGDSEHSHNEARQLEWQAKVEEELRQLEAFRSTEVKVNICNCK